MDVLVVGASGLLGSNVVAKSQDCDCSVAGTYHSTPPNFDVPLRQFDIRDSSAFTELLDEFTPSIVVNCAAMTDVDSCEQNPERAHQVNAVAPVELARLCSVRDPKFVHVSTDYIFDGKSNSRYHEKCESNPIQEYGRSKLAGEHGVLSTDDNTLVIRPSFVYGVNQSTTPPQLEGFPAWVSTQLRTGEDIPLFTDQYITPSRAGSTGKALLELAFDGATGVYHVAAQSCITPYEFGQTIAAELNTETDPLVESSQSAVDREAARPTNTCLSVEKIESRLGRVQPTVEEDVQAISPSL